MNGKVLMLGLDAILANMVEKFTAEGILPNIRRLMDRGCFCRLLSCIPAQTPANWNTIGTGATPGRHSVTVWGAHRPDDPAAEVHRPEAFNSGLCLAEYLWETAGRHGKRSVVMNYAGYPPTTEAAVHIDRLFQPARSYYDVALPTVYHNMDRQGGEPVCFRPAEGWDNLPEGDVLAAELPVVPSSEGVGPTYFGLLVLEGAEPRLLICPNRNAQGPVAALRPGKWSDWLYADFSTEEMGEVEGAFRFRLVECAPDGSRFRLYRSEAYPTDGRFVSNPELGHELVERLGPYVHAMQTAGLHCSRELLDWSTVDQALADEATWWAAAAEIAMERTGADLLYVHWHLPDMVEHVYVARVDPTGTEYSPEGAERAWDALRNYYRAIDRFVGEFLDRFNPAENVIAITADHGMPANRKAVALVNSFRDTGWLEFSDDGRAVLWSESKLFFDQNHLWINLEGREPTGVVPPDAYDDLLSAVQARMRDLKDPETGEHVFSFVLTRQEAPVVGLYGEHVGDLVFCYAGGYRWSGTGVLAQGEERVVFPCGGGNHGPMIPTYETETTTVYGMMVLAGPGVRKGVVERPEEKGSRSTLDVAPTLAGLLGIEAPAQNEGRVLHEFLQNRFSEPPARKLTETARKLRPPGGRRTPQLKGDVTDED